MPHHINTPMSLEVMVYPHKVEVTHHPLHPPPHGFEVMVHLWGGGVGGVGGKEGVLSYSILICSTLNNSIVFLIYIYIGQLEGIDIMQMLKK
jgi:hypothetical protein